MTPQVQPQDLANLRSLATGFRVVGGLTALCVNFAWIHVFIGLATMFGMMAPSSKTSDPVSPVFGAAFGGVFVFAGLFVILSGYAMGYYSFVAAKDLERHRNWKLCFGTSIAFLFFQPLGLVVGIIALIMLHKTGMREYFDQTP